MRLFKPVTLGDNYNINGSSTTINDMKRIDPHMLPTREDLYKYANFNQNKWLEFHINQESECKEFTKEEINKFNEEHPDIINNFNNGLKRFNR